MNRFRVLLVVAAAAAAAACTPPKYVLWTSVQRDWRAGVPWGWRVMTDREGDSFTHTNFIGSFEPDFFLGAPSLSVRWYAYGKAHRLPNGYLELYTSVDDYVSQTLDAVYGPKRAMVVDPREVVVDGRRWKHFVVQAAVQVPETARWGTARDDKDNVIVVRQHAYALLPLKTGFYAVIYPATATGYDQYLPHFNQLVNTFQPLTDGPGGPPLEGTLSPSRAALAGRPPFSAR